MKKICLMVLLVSTIASSKTEAQHVIKQIVFDNNFEEKNPIISWGSYGTPFDMQSVQYANLGEKGILRKELNKYQLFDLELEKKWEVTVPERGLRPMYFRIQYIKIVASNEFIYIIENYGNMYTSPYSYKTFITQLDFKGNIVANKPFDNLIPGTFVIMDFFASDEGCHYVATDFYRYKWSKEKTKKDLFGTISKDGLLNTQKEISLPYDPNEKIQIITGVTGSVTQGTSATVVFSQNYYYTDAELGKSYYGDTVPSRLMRYYNVVDNSYFCQTVLINKKGQVSHSLIIDKSKTGNVTGEIWNGATIYCEPQKLFYSFLPIDNDGKGSFKIMVMDANGNVLQDHGSFYDQIVSAEKEICPDCEFKNLKINKVTLLPQNIFYDNFNNCLVVQCGSYAFMINDQLEIKGAYAFGYNGGLFNGIGWLGGWYSGPALSKRDNANGYFSNCNDLKFSEDYAQLTDISSIKPFINNLEKNAFNYIGDGIDLEQKQNRLSNTIITNGEYQYVFTDNSETKKTKMVKLSAE